MAIRPKGFSMTAQSKAEEYRKKLYARREDDARNWIVAVTGEAGDTDESFADWLHDGSVLCKLINKITGSHIKINKSEMAFKKMENIGKFLSACEDYGVSKVDMFQTVDLYEKQNIPGVVMGIHALEQTARVKGYDGPTIGPKEATENWHEFLPEQLQTSKEVIGQQMGSDWEDSQASVSHFGPRRQIDKND